MEIELNFLTNSNGFNCRSKQTSNLKISKGGYEIASLNSYYEYIYGSTKIKNLVRIQSYSQRLC